MIALVPAKGVSTRLPNKHLLPFGESNILGHKIQQLQAVEGVSEVVVSSDSNEILDIASGLGCRAIPRPIEHANGSRSFSDFVIYLCEELGSTDLLWACATSPLVKADTYEKAIREFEKQKSFGFESLVSVYEFRHHIFTEKGPWNFEIGENHPDSQSIDPLLLFTNGIVIAHTDRMRVWKDHFSSNPFLFRVTQEEAVDIDTFVDYSLARALFENSSLS